MNAMPAQRLGGEDVTFFTARVDGKLAAIGALKVLDETRGEIKSMRAADEWRGSGAGKAMLAHLIEEARSRGLGWLGLETGRHRVFEPAQRLYARHGFSECEAFGSYANDDFCLCMSRTLD